EASVEGRRETMARRQPIIDADDRGRNAGSQRGRDLRMASRASEDPAAAMKVDHRRQETRFPRPVEPDGDRAGRAVERAVMRLDAGRPGAVEAAAEFAVEAPLLGQRQAVEGRVEYVGGPIDEGRHP